MMAYIEIADNEYISHAENHICKKCGKVYEVIEHEQTPGCRDTEEEICPYCGHVNRESMTYEFTTSKI